MSTYEYLRFGNNCIYAKTKRKSYYSIKFKSFNCQSELGEFLYETYFFTRFLEMLM